jgi:hypothetical protein
VESQRCSDLHFLYGQGCWVFLYMFISHLYFLFWELFNSCVQQVRFTFFERLGFLAPCIFWLLILYQM